MDLLAAQVRAGLTPFHGHETRVEYGENVAYELSRHNPETCKRCAGEAAAAALVARVTAAEQLLRRVARSPDPKWINEQVDSYFAARLDGSSGDE